MTDRARTGLVALYDIWPGNGVGSILTNPEPARGCWYADGGDLNVSEFWLSPLPPPSFLAASWE